MLAGENYPPIRIKHPVQVNAPMPAVYSEAITIAPHGSVPNAQRVGAFAELDA